MCELITEQATDSGGMYRGRTDKEWQKVCNSSGKQ